MVIDFIMLKQRLPDGYTTIVAYLLRRFYTEIRLNLYIVRNTIMRYGVLRYESAYTSWWCPAQVTHPENNKCSMNTTCTC